MVQRSIALGCTRDIEHLRCECEGAGDAANDPPGLGVHAPQQLPHLLRGGRRSLVFVCDSPEKDARSRDGSLEGAAKATREPFRLATGLQELSIEPLVQGSP